MAFGIYCTVQGCHRFPLCRQALLPLFTPPSRISFSLYCNVEKCYRYFLRRQAFDCAVEQCYRFHSAADRRTIPRAVSDRVNYCVVENSFRCLSHLPELLPLSIEPSSTATAISSAVQHLFLSLLRCRERSPLLIAPPIEQLFQELLLLSIMPSSFLLRRREVLPLLLRRHSKTDSKRCFRSLLHASSSIAFGIYCTVQGCHRFPWRRQVLLPLFYPAVQNSFLSLL